MFRTIIFLAVALSAMAAFGQSGSGLRLEILDTETKRAVSGAAARVIGTDITGTADANGRLTLDGIPPGKQSVEVSSPGYETALLTMEFPLADENLIVHLKINFEAGEVTISSTRTGREIAAEPTRVEAIDEEEIEEKINMRPANVSMLLNESTGIQIQQTSAASNTQSVRIQGLDGRYTQILKDGFPAFGGFSGSLSILEIPPLDLKQVEVIKGPSATLYGGGAIAGVVNFITREPEDEPVTSMIFNQTSALGTDASLFHSNKKGRFGYTFLGSANFQREYDVDDDDFTELPRTRSFSLGPKLFVELSERTRLTVGTSFSYQTRSGGDRIAIRQGPTGVHQYFEKTDSLRSVTAMSFDHVLTDGSRFVAKQSIALYDRATDAPGYRFGGRQLNSFTEAAYFRAIGKSSFVFGGNVFYDSFREDDADTGPFDRSETRTTVGGFVQHTIDLTDRLAIESGLRVDAVRHYGTFALPRVSLLYRFTDNFSTRVGFGLGYKTPSVFTEQAEERLFRRVAGIGNSLKAEHSQGGTLDLNYRGSLGEKFGYSINQLFFYTQVTDPLVLERGVDDIFRFRNADSPIISRGFETNVKLTYGIAKLFLGYTFTDARAGYLGGNRRLTLVPRNSVNSSLVFEEHENFKAGIEAYFTGRQVLDDRSLTRATAEVGVFAEKTFGRISIFINGENLTDVRQGRYGPVVLGPHNDPTFAEIYTHLEGRTFNGGIKLRF